MFDVHIRGKVCGSAEELTNKLLRFSAVYRGDFQSLKGGAFQKVP